MRIRGTAIRWESDDFPGWIAVVVHDSSGKGHFIVEKVPVLTSCPLTADFNFPIVLWLDATTQAERGDTVDVALSHGVHTVGGVSHLTLAGHDVKGCCRRTTTANRH